MTEPKDFDGVFFNVFFYYFSDFGRGSDSQGGGKASIKTSIWFMQVMKLGVANTSAGEQPTFTMHYWLKEKKQKSKLKIWNFLLLLMQTKQFLVNLALKMITYWKEAKIEKEITVKTDLDSIAEELRSKKTSKLVVEKWELIKT